MEILMLNPFFHPYIGGTEKHIYYLGSKLSKKHNIRILTAHLTRTKENEEIEGMEIIRTPAKIFYNAPHPFPPPVPILHNFKKHFVEVLGSGKNEIVHIHNRFIYRSSIGKIAKEHGSKLLLTIHNSRPKGIDLITDLGGGLFDDLIAHKLMRQCHGITAVSKAAYLDTVPKDFKGIGEAIHNGVDEKIFRPQLRKTKENVWKERFRKNNLSEFIVLTNARLLEQKGIKYLIQSMKNISKASLVVFGRGPLQKELENEARKNHISFLFITEKISEKELVELYQAADVFVLPSLYEPCGIALLEAMACGLPCIGSNAGGIPELISANKNGQIVSARSADSIEQAILRFMEDDKFRKKCAINARKKVENELTWDKIAKKIEKFYLLFEE